MNMKKESVWDYPRPPAIGRTAKRIRIVLDGKTRADGECPTNMTGGLCGFGHPTGATGVRQVADMVLQLTNQAGDCQVEFKEAKPYAMSINMGGNDKTVTAFVIRRAE